MTTRKTPRELDSRLEDVSRLLREHHLRIEPDAQFAARILARLPRHQAWSFAWAARRVLPVSVALAVALMVAIVTTDRSTGRASSAGLAPSTSSSESDPLEWILDGRQDLR